MHQQGDKMKTNRELDVLVAEKIYKTKVTFLNQQYGHRIDYVGETNEVNTPIMVMDMVDKWILTRFSSNVEEAFNVIHKLHPDDEAFTLNISSEVNEGFSGYTAYLNNVVGSGPTVAYAIVDAALNLQEQIDNPPPKEEDMYMGKSVYMKKDGEEGFIGIHGTYFTGELSPMEAWLNVYDTDKKFRYSAARLVNDPVESIAEEYKKDGWVEVPDFEDGKPK